MASVRPRGLLEASLLALALLASYSPAVIFSAAGSDVLAGRLATLQYSGLAHAYYLQAEAAEVLWAALGLCLLDRAQFSKRVTILRRKVALPRAARAAAAGAAVTGVLLFAVCVLINVEWLLGTYHFTPPILPDSPLWSDFPATALAGFSAAFAGVTVLRLERGPAAAVEWAATRFAAPALIAYECLTWRLDAGEMSLHATMAVHWVSAFGFYLLSNWFVLGFSASLVAFGLLRSPLAARHARGAAVGILVMALLLTPVLAASALGAAPGSATVRYDLEVPGASTTLLLANGTVVSAGLYNLSLSYGGAASCVLIKGAGPVPQAGSIVPLIGYRGYLSPEQTQLLLGESFTGAPCDNSTA